MKNDTIKKIICEIIAESNTSFKAGDKVKLRPDVLARHAKSVPAHTGYTTTQFSWRGTLDKLEGKVGTVTKVFPNSKHVNVTFQDSWSSKDGSGRTYNVNTIGIDSTELVPVSEELAESIKHIISKPVKDHSTGEWVVKWMTNGKRDEDKTYYTDDKQDAIDTAKHMTQKAAEFNSEEQRTVTIKEGVHSVLKEKTPTDERELRNLVEELGRGGVMVFHDNKGNKITLNKLRGVLSAVIDGKEIPVQTNSKLDALLDKIDPTIYPNYMSFYYTPGADELKNPPLQELNNPPLQKKHESVEYNVECPKCHNKKAINLNPSMPEVWQCTKCNHKWNPWNVKEEHGDVHYWGAQPKSSGYTVHSKPNKQTPTLEKLIRECTTELLLEYKEEDEIRLINSIAVLARNAIHKKDAVYNEKAMQEIDKLAEMLIKIHKENPHPEFEIPIKK
jgi:hypothetical protein